MKNGSIVEEGLTKRVFENPKHNYTKKLLSSKIDIKLNKSPLADPILKVRDLSVIYSLKKGLLRRNVFDLKADMQKTMQNYFGVYRNKDLMKKGIDKLSEIEERTKSLHVRDKSSQFNSSQVATSFARLSWS